MISNNKKAALIVVLVFMSLGLLSILLPIIGRIPSEDVIKYRKDELTKWHNLTTKYFDSNPQSQSSLFDIYMYGVKIRLVLPNIIVPPNGRNVQDQVVGNPAQFEKLVQYELTMNDHGGWTIKEKTPGFIYRRGLFVINEDAEISEIKTEKGLIK